MRAPALAGAVLVLFATGATSIALGGCSKAHDPGVAATGATPTGATPTGPAASSAGHEPDREGGVSASVSGQGAATSDASDRSALQPLTEAEWLEHFKLEGGDEASVTVPLGATSPRPVVIAVHGAGDRPEWACGGWRMVFDSYAFVVCPQGVSVGNGRFSWGSADQITRIVDKALPALRRRFGVFVAEGPLVYVGFSQGARLGVVHTAARARDYEAIAPVEGAYEDVDATFASKLVSAGGRKVLLACSTGNCEARFAPAKSVLARKVEVRVQDLGRYGHNLSGHVVENLREPAAWLVKDDPRWAGLPFFSNERLK